MPASFNPPPNWPKPPEGWEPEPGWQPDPSWGPAPEGWNFWKDEHGNPIGGQQPQAGTSSDAPTTPISTGGSTAAGAPATVASSADPGPAAQGWDHDHRSSDPNAQGGWNTPTGPADGGMAQAEAGWGQQNGGPSGNWGGSAAAGAAGHGAGNAGGQGGWNGGGSDGGPNGWNSDGSNHWNQGGGPNGEPPRKKGFFSSVAGILTIVGVFLLVLVVLLVLFLTGVLGSHKDDASDQNNGGNQTQSAPASPSDSESSQDTASESSSASEEPGDGPTPEGYDSVTPVKTFEGDGSKTMDLDSLGTKRYVVTYEYSGDGSFSLEASGHGHTQFQSVSSFKSTAGATWINLDAKDTDQLATSLAVKESGGSDGHWKLKIYDGSYTVENKESQPGHGTFAFSHRGEGSTLDFKNESDSGMTLDVYDDDGNSVTIEYVDRNSSKTVKLPAGQRVNILVGDADCDDNWTATFK